MTVDVTAFAAPTAADPGDIALDAAVLELDEVWVRNERLVERADRQSEALGVMRDRCQCLTDDIDGAKTRQTEMRRLITAALDHIATGHICSARRHLREALKVGGVE